MGDCKTCKFTGEMFKLGIDPYKTKAMCSQGHYREWGAGGWIPVYACHAYQVVEKKKCFCEGNTYLELMGCNSMTAWKRYKLTECPLCHRKL